MLMIKALEIMHFVCIINYAILNENSVEKVSIFSNIIISSNCIISIA